MPRHSGAQPGAMVTEHDHWSGGTIIAVVAAMALAVVVTYVLWA